MSYVRALATGQKDQYLREAARERAWVTLAARTPNGWTQYKTRLLKLQDEPPLLVVEYPAGTGGRAAPDIGEGQLMGMTFRRGHRKCVFTTAVLGKQRLALAEHTHLGALLMRWPEEMQELQRRAYQRVDVPAGCDIEAGFWPQDTKLSPRKPPPDPLFAGQVANLSAGGFAVTVGASDARNVRIGDVLVSRFALVKHHPPFTIQVLLRHAEPADTRGNVEIGCQFLGLEFSPRTLARLTRAVTQFQRFNPSVRR